jgi:aryl-alcohol dehydrogenase-like predicted oxidoreductase
MLQRTMLGQTGIEVARLGIASSFGADTNVYHEALEAGCNYFTWGTFIRGRSSPFKIFFQQLVEARRRAEVVLGLLSYSHTGFFGNLFLESALRQMGTDYIDCLILGYYPKRPPNRVLDWARRVKSEGKVRAIGLTTHNRAVVPELIQEGVIDFFHIRYNAVHRGAEQDIFPHLGSSRPGLVSFTATCWGKLLKQSKMPDGVMAPTAGDCYRFVLARDEIDISMMGVKDLTMFRENLAEIRQGPLGEEDMVRMRAVGDRLYGRSRPS